MKPGKKYVSPNGVEFAMFPAYGTTSVPLVEQREQYVYSHNGSKALDFIVGTFNKPSTWQRFDILAPFTGRVLSSSASGGIIFQSVNPVIWANGKVEIATCYFMHSNSNDLPARGTVIAQGERVTRAGDASSPGLIHLHLECGNANSTVVSKNGYYDPYNGAPVYELVSSQNPYDVLFNDDAYMSRTIYTWKDTGGLAQDGSQTNTFCFPSTNFEGQYRGFSHMFYQSITDRTSAQYLLQQQCSTNPDNAIRMLGNRHCVAVGQRIGKTGDKLDIVFDNGSINGRQFFAIVGDSKRFEDTMNGAGWVGKDGAVVEIIADAAKFHELGIKSYSSFLFSERVRSICRVGEDDTDHSIQDGYKPKGIDAMILEEDQNWSEFQMLHHLKYRV